MVVMKDIEISCKGHCENYHFLDHVSHTVFIFISIENFTQKFSHSSKLSKKRTVIISNMLFISR